MAAKTISAGSAPIVWSTVDEAFDKINSNFQELYATLEANDITAIDFTSLNSSLIPADNETYDLGFPTKRWRDIYVSKSISLGGAQITSEGLHIDLPSGTTVGGELVINPSKAFFNKVSVNSESAIYADENNATFNFEAGTGMDVIINSSSESVIFNNTGVTKLEAGTALQVTATNGDITITNTGVASLTAGQGVGLSGTTGAITVTNNGVLKLSAGVGITLSNTGLPDGTGNIIITNSAPAGNSFRTVAIFGTVYTATATNSADTVTFKQGPGINMITDGGRQVTFTNTGVLSLTVGAGLTINSATGNVVIGFDKTTDMNASIFADNSTLLVDAVNGSIPAAVVQGTFTGYHIGDTTGSVFADDSTKLIDAVEGKIVGPVFANVTGNTYGTHVGIVNTSLIASADSSAIQVTSPITLQGDVRAENDIIIGTAGGTISSDYLKPVILQAGGSDIITVTTGGFYNSGVQATAAAAPTIASSGTIAPTKDITFISGTNAIATITPPSPISAGGGQITLIPTGIFTTTTAGNIALASTAVVGKALIMTYDSVTSKWYPSY